MRDEIPPGVPSGAMRESGGKKPPTRLRTVTAADAIYATLREELVSLARRPGEAIVERELASAYGVSRTPVREAILRLADEGLIEIFPQAGTFAARIPISALPEAIIIRKALEETTARLAAERRTPRDIAGLAAILKRQRALSAIGDHEAFHRADEAFHAAIADAAKHPGIWTLVQQVKLQVDRCRRLTLPQKGRMALVVREHAAVAAAIERSDPAAAAARMGKHLERLLGDVAAFRNLNPEFFVEDAPPRATDVGSTRRRQIA